jgi:hypothetical protein
MSDQSNKVIIEGVEYTQQEIDVYLKNLEIVKAAKGKTLGEMTIDERSALSSKVHFEGMHMMMEASLRWANVLRESASKSREILKSVGKNKPIPLEKSDPILYVPISDEIGQPKCRQWRRKR